MKGKLAESYSRPNIPLESGLSPPKSSLRAAPDNVNLVYVVWGLPAAG